MPTVTSPRSVNLIALLPRLTSTWRSRAGSPIRRAGRSGAALNSSSSPFSSAFRPSTSAISPTTVSSSKSMRSSVQVAGLDLRDVEDVVEDLQQVARRAVRLLDVVALLAAAGRPRARGGSCR